MRRPGLLLLAAAALAARARAATTYGVYPKCTPAGTQQFVDALNKASNGCTAASSYVWDGDADPTTDQRTQLCKCTLADFNIPKCSWLKAAVYNVSVNEHFHYVYNCQALSGNATPNVTEVAAAVGNGTAASSADLCSAVQVSSFTTALRAASSCLGASSYNWAGTTNPTDAQYDEICVCAAVADFAIPSCSVMKGPDKVTLAAHYAWVLKTQCPLRTTAATTETKSSSSSSNAGLIAGIAGGVVVVALIVGVLLWRRKRHAAKQQVEYASHAHGSGPHDMRSPVAFQPMHGTPPVHAAAYNNKGADASRPSGVSTVSTTISTANGTVRPSGSHGTGASAHSTEATGKWDDPVIVAVRIPYDSIFIGALISRGGFGEVYKGTCRGETVAIKSLLPERRKDLAQIDDFLSEVKLMSSLEHERIVRFIGVAWNSLSDACMVVEFMENGDLRSVLTRWDAPGAEQRANGFDADKVKIALHVAHALVYLHSLQPVVVHRDLKSKNVLLDANLDAKLTDFGISRERADSTMTAGVGSSLWMAPEVMLGSRYDEKADVFSFGVVLSELDTHQLPYFHAKVSESGQKLPEAAILQQVMLGRVSVGFTDRADPALVQLGRECVSLDPKDRPTTAQVLHRVHLAMKQYK